MTEEESLRDQTDREFKRKPITVPKFSSFRPKAKPSTEQHQVRADKVAPSKTHAQDQEHGLRPAKQRKTEHVVLPSTAKKDTTSREWMFDRRGDHLIEQFKSLHKYDIPKYRRTGYGRVIGGPKGARINRELSTTKQIVLDVPDRRDTARSLLSISGAKFPKRTRRIHVERHGRSEESTGEAVDFIQLPVSSRKSRKEKANGDVFALMRDEESDRNKSDHDDGSLSGESSDGDLDNSVDASIGKRNAFLTAETKREPQEVQHWLALINHQEQMVLLGRRKHAQAISSNGKQGLSAIKVSIYKQALARVSDEASKEKLWLGMLRQGQDLWDSKQLEQQWNKALESLPKSSTLRMKYLDFIQTKSNSYSINDVRIKYIECLKVIKQVHRSKDENTSAYLQTLVFLRLTTFLRQSGYRELAVALWQAIVEFVVLRPPEIPNAEALQLFEDFWDNESFRAGESSLSVGGWQAYVSGQTESTPALYFTPPQLKDAHDPSYFEQYVQNEWECEQKLFTPGKTHDQAGDDDPYHVVFFSDLEPCLSVMFDGKEMAEPLIWAFLCFSGLPPLAFQKQDDSRYYDWWKDPLIWDQGCNMWDKAERVNYPAEWARGVSMTQLLFDSGEVFSSKLSVDKTWVRQVLMQLLTKHGQWEELMEYIVAVQHAMVGSLQASKLCKSLLKQNKSSLRLYKIYGLLEQDDAARRKILSTALNMSKSNGHDRILLLLAWLQKSLSRQAITEAEYILLSIGAERISEVAESLTTFSPAQVLQVKSRLNQGLEKSLYEKQYYAAAAYVEVLGWLAYFQALHSHRHPLVPALQVFDENRSIISPDVSLYRELLCQSQALLMRRHSRLGIASRKYRPADIKPILCSIIKEFPSNTLIRQAYAEYQQGFSIDDKLREVDITRQPSEQEEDTVIIWLFKVWAERNRIPELGGTIHGVRSILDQATEAQLGRHSIALWLTYLNFEYHKGSLQSLDKAVQRGLSQVPWSKQFLMTGLLMLARKRQTFAELAKIYRVIDERELRSHLLMT